MGVFRVMPKGPVEAYKTYSMVQGSDLSVVAACHEVGCEHWARGWETHVDESTDLGQRQAAYIRRASGRTFTESRTGAGVTVFRFASGQRCFTEHRTRPQRFLVRGGDWRASTGLIREHTGFADWQDDMANHLIGLKETQERG